MDLKLFGIPEILAIFRRGNADIFFKGAAEMTAVIEPQAVADIGNRQAGIHQQVLGFADFPVHQVFYRRQTDFCFKDV